MLHLLVELASYSMNRVFVLHLVLVKIGSSRYLGGSLGIDTDLIIAWAAAVGIGTEWKPSSSLRNGKWPGDVLG